MAEYIYEFQISQLFVIYINSHYSTRINLCRFLKRNSNHKKWNGSSDYLNIWIHCWKIVVVFGSSGEKFSLICDKINCSPFLAFEHINEIIIPARDLHRCLVGFYPNFGKFHSLFWHIRNDHDYWYMFLLYTEHVIQFNRLFCDSYYFCN